MYDIKEGSATNIWASYLSKMWLFAIHSVKVAEKNIIQIGEYIMM